MYIKENVGQSEFGYIDLYMTFIHQGLKFSDPKGKNLHQKYRNRLFAYILPPCFCKIWLEWATLEKGDKF